MSRYGGGTDDMHNEAHMRRQYIKNNDTGLQYTAIFTDVAFQIQRPPGLEERFGKLFFLLAEKFVTKVTMAMVQLSFGRGKPGQ